MSEVDGSSKESVVRGNISILLDQNKFDEIGALPGFEIIERADPNSDNNLDCYMWTLKSEGGSVYTRLKKFSGEHHLVHNPLQGDIVTYFSEGKMTHMGRLNEEGRVRSKFGKGHVYEHPIGDVPDYYLDKENDIRFYRKNI